MIFVYQPDSIAITTEPVFTSLTKVLGEQEQLSSPLHQDLGTFTMFDRLEALRLLWDVLGGRVPFLPPRQR